MSARQLRVTAIGRDITAIAEIIASQDGLLIADLSPGPEPAILSDPHALPFTMIWAVRRSDLDQVRLVERGERGWEVDFLRSPVLEFPRAGFGPDLSLGPDRLHYEAGHWDERAWRPASPEFAAWCRSIMSAVRTAFKRAPDGSREGPEARQWRLDLEAGRRPDEPDLACHSVGHDRPPWAPLADVYVAVAIEAPACRWPRGEGLFAVQLDEGTFRLESIPFYAPGLAPADVVRASWIPGSWARRVEVVRPSSRRAARVDISKYDLATVSRILGAVPEGIHWESWAQALLVADVTGDEILHRFESALADLDIDGPRLRVDLVLPGG